MKLYKIGDVSKLCDISIKTLRYYEEEKLITPVEVDIYTGYRYYNLNNIETIYKIKFLKELGFTLNEIRTFDDESLNTKYKEIQDKIIKLKENLQTISYLQKQKGGRMIREFQNDEQVIGKWSYESTTISKEKYFDNDVFVDQDVLLKDLYFLPNGEGYWIIEKWTKGLIYETNGITCPYKIVNDKLFLEIYNENNEYCLTLVYNKIDNKKYSKKEIGKHDDINIPFVIDNDAVGFWKAYNYIKYEDKDKYTASEARENLFIRSLSLSPDGTTIMERSDGEFCKNKWTKDYIINHDESLLENYIIKELDNNTYLIMDWKSGDYVYGSKIRGCYVFKKIK